MIGCRTDKGYQRFAKAVVCALVATMLFTLVVPPIAEASIWEERKKSLDDLQVKKRKAERPWEAAAAREFQSKYAEFQIPEEMGRVVDSYQPVSSSSQTGPTVIHIQDAHSYAASQENLAKLVKFFHGPASETPLLVCAEGAWDKVETEWLHVFPEKGVLKSVSDNLLAKGEVTGEEWVSIQEGNDFADVQGIEDEEIYWDNVDAKRSVEAVRGKILEGAEPGAVHIKSIFVALDRLGQSKFPGKITEMESKRDQLASGELSVGPYALYLKSLLAPPVWEKNASPSLQSFAAVAMMEASLDWKQIANERDDALRVMRDKLDRNTLAQLADYSLKFRLGQVSPGDYYGRFAQLAELHDCRVPEMRGYISYLQKSDAIDVNRVKEDLEQIEAAAEGALTADQPAIVKKVLAAKKWVRLSKKLWTLEMSPEEWKNYGKQSGAMNWTAVRNVLSESGALADSDRARWAEFESYANANQGTAWKYYERAHERDKILAENSLRLAREKGADKLILVAGGFHTAGILRALRDHKTRYVVVRPNLGDMKFVKRDEALSQAILEAGTLRNASIFTSPAPAALRWVSALTFALRTRMSAARSEEVVAAYGQAVDLLAENGSEPARQAQLVLGKKMRWMPAVFERGGMKYMVGTMALAAASVAVLMISDGNGNLLRSVVDGAEVINILTQGGAFNLSEQISGARIVSASGFPLDQRGLELIGLGVAATLAGGKIAFSSVVPRWRKEKHLLSVSIAPPAAQIPWSRSLPDFVASNPGASNTAKLAPNRGATMNWVHRLFYPGMKMRDYTLYQAPKVENRISYALGAGFAGLPMYYLTGSVQISASFAFLAAWPLFYLGHVFNPQLESLVSAIRPNSAAGILADKSRNLSAAAKVSAINILLATTLFYGIPLIVPSVISFAAFPIAFYLSWQFSFLSHQRINQRAFIRSRAVQSTARGAGEPIRSKALTAIVSIVFLISAVFLPIRQMALDMYPPPSLSADQISMAPIERYPEKSVNQTPAVQEIIPKFMPEARWWTSERYRSRIITNVENRQAVRQAAAYYDLPARLGFAVLSTELFNMSVIEPFTDPLVVRYFGHGTVGIAQINTETARARLMSDPNLRKKISEIVKDAGNNDEKYWREASTGKLESILNNEEASIWIMTSYLKAINIRLGINFKTNSKPDPFDIGQNMAAYQHGVILVPEDGRQAYKEVFDRAYSEAVSRGGKSGIDLARKIINGSESLNDGKKHYLERAVIGALDYNSPELDSIFNDIQVLRGEQPGNPLRAQSFSRLSGAASPVSPSRPTATPSPTASPSQTSSPVPDPVSTQAPARQGGRVVRGDITGYNPYLGGINLSVMSQERIDQGLAPLTASGAPFEPLVFITLHPDGSRSYRYNPGGHVAAGSMYPLGTRIVIDFPELDANGKRTGNTFPLEAIVADRGGGVTSPGHLDVGFRYEDDAQPADPYSVDFNGVASFRVLPGGLMLWVRDWLLPKFGVHLSPETYRKRAWFIENTVTFIFSGLTFGLTAYFLSDGNLAVAMWAAYLSAWPLFILGHTKRIAALFGSRAPRENLKIAQIIGAINLAIVGFYIGVNFAVQLPAVFQGTSLIVPSMLALASYIVHRVANETVGRSRRKYEESLQEYLDLISQGDDFSEESPDVFLVMGSPDLRAYVYFAAQWKKNKADTGMEIPIVLAGGRGSGTIPLINKLIGRYGNESITVNVMAGGQTVPITLTFEDAKTDDRINETDLVRWLLNRYGIPDGAIKTETFPSGNTSENFESSAEVIAEVIEARVKNKLNPAIAIVTAPPYLLRSNLTAMRIWRQKGLDWRARRYQSYHQKVGGLSDQELIDLGYFVGYPQSYVDRYPWLNPHNELKGAKDELNKLKALLKGRPIVRALDAWKEHLNSMDEPLSQARRDFGRFLDHQVGLEFKEPGGSLVIAPVNDAAPERGVFNSTQQLREEAPARILHTLEAHGLSAASLKAAANLMNFVDEVYRKSFGDMKLYHQHPHNLAVAYAELELAVANGVTSEHNLKVAFLAALLHDFHVRRSDVASSALVSETVLQLRDMLKLNQGRGPPIDAAYQAIVTESMKNEFNKNILVFLGNIHFNQAWPEIHAIIRRTDFPSDVKTPEPSKYWSTSGVGTVSGELRRDIDRWAGVALGALTANQVRAKIYKILVKIDRGDGGADAEGKSVSLDENQTISARRAVMIESAYFEAMAKIPSARRLIVRRLAEMAEKGADQSGFYWLMSPKAVEGEIVPALTNELGISKASNPGSYPFFFVPVLLTPQVLNLIAKLPVSFRENFLAVMDHFARISTDAGVKMPGSGIAPLDDWNIRKGGLNAALYYQAPNSQDVTDEDIAEQLSVLGDLVNSELGRSYLNVDPIGIGGEYFVFKAQTADGKRVALRVHRDILAPGRPSMPNQNAVDTLNALQEQSHDNLMNVFKTGAVRLSGGRRGYQVVEWVEGRSVKQLLAQKVFEEKGLRWSLDVLRQIAEGLIFLHQHRVAHSDLLGENVIVNDAGVAKIIDYFGFSEILKSTNFGDFGDPRSQALDDVGKFNRFVQSVLTSENFSLPGSKSLWREYENLSADDLSARLQTFPLLEGNPRTAGELGKLLHDSFAANSAETRKRLESQSGVNAQFPVSLVILESFRDGLAAMVNRLDPNPEGSAAPDPSSSRGGNAGINMLRSALLRAGTLFVGIALIAAVVFGVSSNQSLPTSTDAPINIAVNAAKTQESLTAEKRITALVGSEAYFADSVINEIKRLPNSKNVLINLIEGHPDYRMRSKSLFVLARFNNPPLEPFIRAFYQDPDNRTRYWAYAELSKFDSLEVYNRVKELNLIPPEVKVLPKQRGNAPNAAIVIIDEYGENASHGPKVSKRARDVLGRNTNIAVYELDDKLVGNYPAGPVLFADASIKQEVRDSLEKLVRERPDTVFVVNISGSGNNTNGVGFILPSEWVKSMGELGVVFVVAGGNDQRFMPFTHAQFDNVIYVAAADPVTLRKEDYSNFAPGFIATNAEPEGTSFAAPKAAARLAQVLDGDKSLSVSDAVQKIRDSARPMPNEPLYRDGLLGGYLPFNLVHVAIAIVGWGILGRLEVASMFLGLTPDLGPVMDLAFKSAVSAFSVFSAIPLFVYIRHGVLGVVAARWGSKYADLDHMALEDPFTREQIQKYIPVGATVTPVPILPFGILAQANSNTRDVQILNWLAVPWTQLEFLRKLLLPIVLAHEGERLQGHSTLHIYLTHPFKLFLSTSSKILEIIQNKKPSLAAAPKLKGSVGGYPAVLGNRYARFAPYWEWIFQVPLIGGYTRVLINLYNPILAEEVGQSDDWSFIAFLASALLFGVTITSGIGETLTMMFVWSLIHGISFQAAHLGTTGQQKWYFTAVGTVLAELIILPMVFFAHGMFPLDGFLGFFVSGGMGVGLNIGFHRLMYELVARGKINAPYASVSSGNALTPLDRVRAALAKAPPAGHDLHRAERVSDNVTRWGGSEAAQIAALLYRSPLENRKSILKSAGLNVSDGRHKEIIELTQRLNLVRQIPYNPPSRAPKKRAKDPANNILKDMKHVVQNQMDLILQAAGSPDGLLLALADKLETLMAAGNKDATFNGDIQMQIRQILAPLADRVGREDVSQELWTASLRRIIGEVKYQELLSIIGSHGTEEIETKVAAWLQGKDIPYVSVKARVKQASSLIAKVARKGLDAEGHLVNDFINVMVVFPDQESLDRALGPERGIENALDPEHRQNWEREVSIHKGFVQSHIESDGIEFKLLTRAGFIKWKDGEDAHWAYKLKTDFKTFRIFFVEQEFQIPDIVLGEDYPENFRAIFASVKHRRIALAYDEDNGTLLPVDGNSHIDPQHFPRYEVYTGKLPHDLALNSSLDRLIKKLEKFREKRPAIVKSYINGLIKLNITFDHDAPGLLHAVAKVIMPVGDIVHYEESTFEGADGNTKFVLDIHVLHEALPASDIDAMVEQIESIKTSMAEQVQMAQSIAKGAKLRIVVEDRRGFISDLTGVLLAVNEGINVNNLNIEQGIVVTADDNMPLTERMMSVINRFLTGVNLHDRIQKNGVKTYTLDLGIPDGVSLEEIKDLLTNKIDGVLYVNIAEEKISAPESSWRAFNLVHTASAFAGWGVISALGIWTAFFGLVPDFGLEADSVIRVVAAIIGAAGLFGAALYFRHGMLGSAGWISSHYFARPAEPMITDEWTLSQIDKYLGSASPSDITIKVRAAERLPFGTLAETRNDAQEVQILWWLVTPWTRFDILRRFLLSIVLSHEGERLLHPDRSTLRIYLAKPFHFISSSLTSGISQAFSKNRIPEDPLIPDVQLIINKAFPALKGPGGTPLPEFFKKNIRFTKIGRFYVLPAPWRTRRPMPVAPFQSVVLAFDPDPAKFNFNRFPPEKVFFDGMIAGQKVSFVQQDFPYADQHFMVIPQMRENRPQVINRNDIELGLRLIRRDSTRRFRLGFNSPTSGATVNHMHLHASFLPSSKSPLEKAGLSFLAERNGVRASKVVGYPARGLFFSSQDVGKLASLAGSYVRYLQDNNVGHTLILAPGGVYVMPVQKNKTSSLDISLSYSEFMGYLEIEGSEYIPDSFSDRSIEEAMNGVSLSADEFESGYRRWVTSLGPEVPIFVSAFAGDERDKGWAHYDPFAVQTIDQLKVTIGKTLRKFQNASPEDPELARKLEALRSVVFGQSKGNLFDNFYVTISLVANPNRKSRVTLETLVSGVPYLHFDISRGELGQVAGWSESVVLRKVLDAHLGSGEFSDKLFRYLDGLPVKPEPASILDPFARKTFKNIPWAYRLFTDVFAPVWETPLFPLAGAWMWRQGSADGNAALMAFGAVWATIGFSFAHVLVRRIAGRFSPALERERDLKYFFGLTALSMGFLAPFLFMDFTDSIRLSIVLHAFSNFAARKGLLPKGWPLASILSGGDSTPDEKPLARSVFIGINPYVGESGPYQPDTVKAMEQLRSTIVRALWKIQMSYPRDFDLEREFGPLRSVILRNDERSMLSSNFYITLSLFTNSNERSKVAWETAAPDTPYIHFGVIRKELDQVSQWSEAEILTKILDAYFIRYGARPSHSLIHYMTVVPYRGLERDLIEERSHYLRDFAPVAIRAGRPNFIAEQIAQLQRDLEALYADQFYKNLRWNPDTKQIDFDSWLDGIDWNEPPAASASAISGRLRDGYPGDRQTERLLPINQEWVEGAFKYIRDQLKFDEKGLSPYIPQAFWDRLEHLYSDNNIWVGSGLNAAADAEDYADHEPRVIISEMVASNLNEALKVVEGDERRARVRSLYLAMLLMHETSEITFREQGGARWEEGPAATVDEEFAAFMSEVRLALTVSAGDWGAFVNFTGELGRIIRDKYQIDMDFENHALALSESRSMFPDIPMWGDPYLAVVFKESILDRFPSIYANGTSAAQVYDFWSPASSRRRAFYLMSPSERDQLFREAPAASSDSPADPRPLPHPVEIWVGKIRVDPRDLKPNSAVNLWAKAVLESGLNIIKTVQQSFPSDPELENELRPVRTLVLSPGFQVKISIQNGGTGIKFNIRPRVEVGPRSYLRFDSLDIVIGKGYLKENARNLDRSRIFSFIVPALFSRSGTISEKLLEYLWLMDYRGRWDDLFRDRSIEVNEVLATTGASNKNRYIETQIEELWRDLKLMHADGFIKDIRWEDGKFSYSLDPKGSVSRGANPGDSPIQLGPELRASVKGSRAELGTLIVQTWNTVKRFIVDLIRGDSNGPPSGSGRIGPAKDRLKRTINFAESAARGVLGRYLTRAAPPVNSLLQGQSEFLTRTFVGVLGNAPFSSWTALQRDDQQLILGILKSDIARVMGKASGDVSLEVTPSDSNSIASRMPPFSGFAVSDGVSVSRLGGGGLRVAIGEAVLTGLISDSVEQRALSQSRIMGELKAFRRFGLPLGGIALRLAPRLWLKEVSAAGSSAVLKRTEPIFARVAAAFPALKPSLSSVLPGLGRSVLSGAAATTALGRTVAGLRNAPVSDELRPRNLAELSNILADRHRQEPGNFAVISAFDLLAYGRSASSLLRESANDGPRIPVVIVTDEFRFPAADAEALAKERGINGAIVVRQEMINGKFDFAKLLADLGKLSPDQAALFKGSTVWLFNGFDLWTGVGKNLLQVIFKSLDNAALAAVEKLTGQNFSPNDRILLQQSFAETLKLDAGDAAISEIRVILAQQ